MARTSNTFTMLRNGRTKGVVRLAAAIPATSGPRQTTEGVGGEEKDGAEANETFKKAKSASRDRGQKTEHSGEYEGLTRKRKLGSKETEE